MEKKNILVYDSGIGGLSVLYELDKHLKGKRLIYYGDNFNAPYGSKHELRLFDIIFNNVLKIPDKFEAIVLACNTASLSVRKMMEDSVGIKTFGVYPSIERELMLGKKTLVLGTPLTVSKIKDVKGLTKIGLKNLAVDIERKIFNLNSLDLKEHFNHQENYSIDYIKKQCFDTIILGCTHYHFIKNLIFNHFQPPKITSGNVLTVNKVLEFCLSSKTLEKNMQNEIFFYGENAVFNEEIYNIYYKNH